MTEAEYLALPETKPYLEFVDGEVLQKAMPDSTHGDSLGKSMDAFGTTERRQVADSVLSAGRDSGRASIAFGTRLTGHEAGHQAMIPFRA